jgi:hypothetical protein
VVPVVSGVGADCALAAEPLAGSVEVGEEVFATVGREFVDAGEATIVEPVPVAGNSTEGS